MRRLFVAVLVTGALAACSSAPSHYYVLSAQPATLRPAPQVIARPATLAIGAIRLPGALDRPQIGRRIGPNQFDYSETDRWAGPLDEMIRRVLAADLRSRLPPGSVLIENSSAAPANVTIAVDIARFDADNSGRVTLEASWEQLDRNAALEGPPVSAIILEPSSGSGSASVAATLSRALAVLADHIAAGI